MYRVCVRQDFIAQHFLIGGDWGAENTPHSHHFILEVELAGPELDQHGYLFDISLIKDGITKIVGDFKDRLLNDCQEFAGLNPSVEHFCRIIATRFRSTLDLTGPSSMTIRLWEDNEAWASFEVDLLAKKS